MSTERRASEVSSSKPGRRTARWATFPGVAFALAVTLLFLTPTGALAVSLPRAPATSAAAPAAVHPDVVFPTPIHHVMIITFENHAEEEIMNDSSWSYMRSIGEQYAIAANFWSVKHGSLPDYIAETSGFVSPNAFLVGGYNVTNIGDLANTAGMSWAGYFEGMPQPCYRYDDPPPPWNNTTLSNYYKFYNPFIQYTDVIQNYSLGYCKAHVLPLTAYYNATSTNVLPNYMFVVPNRTDDAHSGSQSQADSWLQSFLTPILNSTWFNSSAIIVTFDESIEETGPSTTPGPCGTNCQGGHIFTAIISPYAKRGYRSNVVYNAFSDLTTAEWLLGLGRTGQNDSFNESPPMTDLFSFPPAQNYTATGSVVSAATGAPLVGATVSAVSDGANQTVVAGSGGAFSLSIPNGTYALTVSDPGFASATESFVVNGGSVSGLNVRLARVGFSVSGTVTNATGAPIPNATVAATGPVNLSVATDVHGNYSLNLSNGSYSLTASAPGYTPQSRGVNVSGAALANVSFRLSTTPPGVYLVSGSVTGTSGAPISGATVTATWGSNRASAVTGSSGAYSINLGNGTYNLTASATGYSSSAAQTITVKGAAVPGVNFVLVFTSATHYSVAGSVLDATTGLAIAGASVSASVRGLAINSTTTDGLGMYAVSLPNGSYTLTASASGYAEENLSVGVAGAAVSGVNFSLAPSATGPATYLVTGVVEWPNGTGVASATVYANSSTDPYTAVSGSDGSFAMHLPNGTYALVAVGPGFHSPTTTVTVNGAPVSGVTVGGPTHSTSRSGILGFVMDHLLLLVIVLVVIVAIVLASWAAVRSRRPPETPPAETPATEAPSPETPPASAVPPSDGTSGE